MFCAAEVLIQFTCLSGPRLYLRTHANEKERIYQINVALAHGESASLGDVANARSTEIAQTTSAVGDVFFVVRK